MDVLVLATRTAQQLRSAVGNYLVAVHVETDACARLEDVDGEVLVPLAVLDLFCGCDDRLCCLFVDQAKLAIGQRSRLLYHRDSADQGAMRTQTADGKVLHRPRRLNPVV